MSRMSYMRQLYRFIRRDLLLCHIASCDVIWCHSMSCDVFKLDITSVATNSAKSPSQRAVVSYYITWRHMISHDNIWCSMMLIPCYGRLVPHKVTISSFTCHMTSYDHRETEGWSSARTPLRLRSRIFRSLSGVSTWKSGVLTSKVRWDSAMGKSGKVRGHSSGTPH